MVIYEDQAPTKTAVGSNFYNSESGFLHDFSQEERDALVEMQIISPANSLSESPSRKIITKDKVFLLSTSELKWLETADISLYTTPTQSCKDHDKEIAYYNSFSKDYGTDNYYWFLRDSNGGKINEVSIVLTDAEPSQTTVLVSVGIANYGIRPAICIDLHKLK